MRSTVFPFVGTIRETGGGSANPTTPGQATTVDPSYTGAQFHEEYVGYMEANANSQGQVQGDPTQALSYTVDVEKGADALFTCMTQPETVLNLESQ
ncbi:hypothetical protein [Schaalia suimastitidis]|uniref:hypothetical protein n=1 Tax=Schaalia suimastitidis TaxID=121163 RepID=UPI00103A66DE|nr:hypothetical protein [Schaalia suimastitidis]